MSVNILLTDLPEITLFRTFFYCSARDLCKLKQTCQYLNELISDSAVWGSLCLRDFGLHKPNLGEFKSYYELYKNLLNKYGWMLGMYSFSHPYFRGLSEIRYNAGKIECINWEVQPDQDSVVALRGESAFEIQAYSLPPKIICYPCETSNPSHECYLFFNKVTGKLTQRCSDDKSHERSIVEVMLDSRIFDDYKLKRMMVYDALDEGLLRMPVLLPSLDDIPLELKTSWCSIHPQVITPGVFMEQSPKGEVVCFKYTNESEIIGVKVIGNMFHASKGDNSKVLKILLKESVFPSLEQQGSYEDLFHLEHEQRPLSTSQVQPFKAPLDSMFHNAHPNTCKARYNGYMLVPRGHHYIKVHIMIFSDDYIGILMLEKPGYFVSYRRIDQKFTYNILRQVESVL